MSGHGCQTIASASILDKVSGVQHTILSTPQPLRIPNDRCTELLLQKMYLQFQPSKRKPPVSPAIRRGLLSNVTLVEVGTTCPPGWQECLSSKYSQYMVVLRPSLPKAHIVRRSLPRIYPHHFPPQPHCPTHYL